MSLALSNIKDLFICVVKKAALTNTAVVKFL